LTDEEQKELALHRVGAKMVVLTTGPACNRAR